MSEQSGDGWFWYAGADGETFTLGPFNTKEEAIKAALEESVGEDQVNGRWMCCFCVIEAKNPPLKLSQWVDIDHMVDHADESLCNSDRVGENDDDYPIFKIEKAQMDDLEARLKAAIDEWQKAHGLQWSVLKFLASRNEEWFQLPSPGEE